MVNATQASPALSSSSPSTLEGGAALAGRRDAVVSIAKGLAIIIIIYCHSGWYQMNHWLMFELPVFVILSGYCFKERYGSDRWGFVKRRFKGLYVPLVKWGLLLVLLHNVFLWMHLYSTEPYGYQGATMHAYDLRETLVRCAQVVFTMHCGENLGGALWFLRELLVGSLMFIVAYRWAKRWPWLTLLAFMVVVLAVDIVLAMRGINYTPGYCGILYLMGYMLRRYRERIDKGWLVTLLLVALLGVGGVWWYGGIKEVDPTRFVQFTVCSLAATLVTMNVARWIAQHEGWVKRLLVYVGDHTLRVVVWHFFALKVVSLVIILVAGHPIDYLGWFPVIPGYEWASPIYATVGVALPLAVGYLYDRAVAAIKQQRAS